MKAVLTSHQALRYILLWFVGFSFFLLFILVLHFYARTQFESGKIFEQVLGSRIAMQLSPGYRDGFKKSSSPSGILKAQVWHIVSIPLFAFTLLHLLGMIWDNKLFLNWIQSIYIVIVASVLFAPYLFFIHAWMGLYFYYTSFILFIFSTILLNCLLIYNLLRNNI